jgi:hypothetical protein
VGVMKMLPRGKENLERLQMGSALALMSKVLVYIPLVSFYFLFIVNDLLQSC